MVKTKVMDFFKVLKDPDINRAITFGFSFLKAFGQGLEKNRVSEKVMGSNHHFFHCMYKSVHVKRNILLLKDGLEMEIWNPSQISF